MLRPNGTPAERLYPPLVPMLAYGREALAAIRGGGDRLARGRRDREPGRAAGPATDEGDGHAG